MNETPCEKTVNDLWKTRVYMLYHKPWCSWRHKSDSGLSDARKDTVTMTTRAHSSHEWMEEGNEVNRWMDHESERHLVQV